MTPATDACVTRPASSYVTETRTDFGPVGAFVRNRKTLTLVVDRGAILLIVYSAFSAGTVSGLWASIPPTALIALIAVMLVLLAFALLILLHVLLKLLELAERCALLPMTT